MILCGVVFRLSLPKGEGRGEGSARVVVPDKNPSPQSSPLCERREANPAATTLSAPPTPSLVCFQFFKQLLFQMAARCLFNRTSLGSHCFLFRLAFFSSPYLNGLC